MTSIAPPGLKGLVVADTEIGAVRGDEGFFHYRQHDATELARTRPLEAIWALVWDGALPEPPTLDRFRREIADRRALSDDLAAVVDHLADRAGSPHAVLQAALPLVLPDARPTLDLTAAERRDQALSLAASVPTILARYHRRRTGAAPVFPDADRSHAADWLTMVTGATPTADQTRAVETYLASTIDHGFNASTFAARVITSTGADLAGVLVGAVAALSGPLHGGAPSRALEMIDAIGDPAHARSWARARLDAGEKLMGFGHAVYRTEDPRSRLLRDVAVDLGGDRVARAVAIEAEILAELREWKPSALIVTNVEYYASLVLELAGLPPEMFTPTFTVSRSIGWCAHALEQASDNKIMRPTARYIGPPPRSPAMTG